MGKLLATICSTGCGQISIPPKDKCINCSKHTEQLEISDTGTILTYTILQTPPEGFNAPLVLGLVELELGQVNEKNQNLKPPKLMCQGIILNNELKIGLRVNVEKNQNKYFFKKMEKNEKIE